MNDEQPKRRCVLLRSMASDPPERWEPSDRDRQPDATGGILSRDELQKLLEQYVGEGK